MAAAEFVSRLRQDGIQLEVAGDRIRVRPKRLLTDPMRQMIREHKQELLEYLAAQRRLDLIASDPFRQDFPSGMRNPVVDPPAGWTCPQYQAWVTAGADARERWDRLKRTPKEFRRRVLSHVRGVYLIRQTRK